MLKNIFTGIGIFAIMSSVVFGVWDRDFKGKNEVLAAEERSFIDDVFKDSGCEWVQVNVNGWAMINLNEVSMDNMQNIGVDAADFFQLKNYDVFKNENEFMKQVNISGLDDNGDLVNIIISSEIGFLHNNETYIVVDIVSKDQDRSSSHMVEKQEEFFQDLNAVPMISTTIMGTFDAKYDEDHMDSICRRTFENLGGEITQIMKEDGVISMAGYSPYIKESLKAGKNLINFQVAMRYSPYWGKTYIWIGTPIITTEY